MIADPFLDMDFIVLEEYTKSADFHRRLKLAEEFARQEAMMGCTPAPEQVP